MDPAGVQAFDRAAGVLPRLPRLTVACTLGAVMLALLGGLVPGIAHQVQAGRLPQAFEPEQYLGPPYAGSISGSTALTGALLWSTLATTGLLLQARSLRVGTWLLVFALALTALANVALPVASPNTGWSILGVLQTTALTAALAGPRLTRYRRGRQIPPRPGLVQPDATSIRRMQP